MLFWFIVSLSSLSLLSPYSLLSHIATASTTTAASHCCRRRCDAGGGGKRAKGAAASSGSVGTGGDLSITDEGSSDEEGPACGYCYGCRKNRGWCTHDGVPGRDDAAEAAALQDVEVVETVEAVQDAAAAAAAATTALADGSGPAGDSCTFSSVLVLGDRFLFLLAQMQALLGSGPRERQQPMAHVLAAQQDQVIASAAAAAAAAPPPIDHR